MKYCWTHYGSVAAQEKRMQQMCLLGPYTLHVVESGWSNDTAIWAATVGEWQQELHDYITVFEPKFQFTDLNVAKQYLEDWYATNVLIEDLMIGNI
jgi:hypothetical protein